MAYMKFIGLGAPDKYKDSTAFSDIISYCCQPSKAIHIGLSHLSSIHTAASEMEAVSQRARQSSGKKLCHVVIAFDHKEAQRFPLETFIQIAEICSKYFSDRFQILYAIHNEPCIHIHLVWNRVSYVDFKRFLNRYQDQYQFQSFVYNLLQGYHITLWK